MKPWNRLSIFVAAWRALLLTVVGAAHCSAQSGTPVPSTFFAMSASASNFPKVTIGFLAHGDFAWVQIERSKGNFNFQAFDNYMAAAQQHGLVDLATNTATVAITLAAGTPIWAVADQSTCSSGNDCTAPPDNIQDWKDFITALIQHYNGKTQPHIKYYELWNEFNVSLWWTGNDAQMLALAQAAYPIIHQDPYSILLTPSVAGPVGTASPNSSVTTMTSYLQAGGSRYADGGAFHGYLGAQGGVNPFPFPEEDTTSGCKAFVGCYGSIITKATQMRSVFDQNGLAGKPMFQTEGSWGNNTITDSDTQVAWLARFNLLQAGLRSTLNLQMVAWFTWALPSFGWGDIATASLDPTPAGLAYSEVFKWVVGATISQPCSGASNGTWTCTLTRAGGYVAQAVWNTQGTIAYSLGAGYTQYRDLTGKTAPISPGASVSIGVKPILIEGTAAGTGALGIVSAARYNGPPLAPESLASAFGASLANSTVSATATPLPTTLGATQVSVTDSAGVTRLAPLVFVASAQINYQVPAQTASGLASVSVSNNGKTVAAGGMMVASVAPALFTANANGQGVAAALAVTVNSSGAQSTAPVYQCGAAAGSCISSSINVSTPGTQVVLELYGTGIRSRSALANVKCTIAGTPALVVYAGPQGQFAGLDQVNVQVPPNLAATGETNVVLTVDGVVANTVRINLQ